MKKLIAVLLSLCLLGAAAAAGLGAGTFAGEKEQTEPTSAPEKPLDPAEPPAPEDEPVPAEPEAKTQKKTVDYATLYGLHDPGETVMTIDGQPITWQEYFAMYYSEAAQMEQQFTMAQYYGQLLGWQDRADEEGHCYADLVPLFAEESLRQLITLEGFAEENQIRLTPEEEDQLQQEHEANIARLCGSEGTEEDFYRYLEGIYLPSELYWRMSRANYLYQESYLQLYGAEGQTLSDEEALAYMEEQGLLSANHILLSTQGLTDEAAVAETKKQAEEIAAELQAIEDREQRIARFLELKAQYCDDGGDYVFSPGVMETEFEEGTRALEEYQISDPVQSRFGFHIILRRPLDADAAVVSAAGSGMTGRAMAANAYFARQLQDRMDSLQTEYVQGFRPPALLDYYR